MTGIFDNVTSMRYMFYNCVSLENIDLSRFNTSKVTTMGYMFKGLPLLSLNLSQAENVNS